ncbi:rhomboid family intramembrane serine protease [Chitiniphilus eburneus]|uniref:Rhomboid family intramembrane serine protease n=1 Tax=Chitiniphilus eburneus TaxID=2571148 RepID=A0A4U0PSP1_9NEIS|nr:rhomboid family intramembrane serine protease [Chitiniphilus eburneus]TJZ71040.1 rhomboid family intramembrane serine protease [Chitiniphilus eburneus]
MRLLPPLSWFRHAPVSVALIAANVLVFLVQLALGVPLLGPDSAGLVQWGANTHGLTLAGEPWRLLTSMFLHIGVIHLLVNMYSLAIMGPLVERELGAPRFAALYLAAGIAGGMASTLWNANTLSAGASGAIMGLAGAYFALLLATRRHGGPGHAAALRQIAQVIVLNVGLGLAIDGIDNACHLGGLAGGAVVTWGYVLTARRRPVAAWTVAWLLLVSGAQYGLLRWQSPDTLWYERVLHDSVATVERYSDFDTWWRDTPPARRNDALSQAVAAWQACVDTQRRAAQRALPPADQQLASHLGTYCNLRLAQYRVNQANWSGSGYLVTDWRYRLQADQTWHAVAPRLSQRLAPPPAGTAP